MHQQLFENLSITTFLLQFYGFLARGFYTLEERQEISDLVNKNINRLILMKNEIEWDGRYDLVLEQIIQTNTFLTKLKTHIKFKQICEDKIIALYMKDNANEFHLTGISLFHLKEIFDISSLRKNGYMLHDSYVGYPEKDLYQFHIDCIDYVNSAAYFYNEAYDYFNSNKEVNYNIDLSRGRFHEFKRIQSKEEIMFRNYREAYINILFFMESFINSVGFDAYLSGLAKDENDENQLKGIENINPKNGYIKYSTLRQRLENIPRIINSKRIDTNQDPFKSYLQNDVELRNKYVHSSPEKGRILLGLEDWKSKCDKLIQSDCFTVLNEFWSSCYPNQIFPKVIFNTFWGNSFKGHQSRSYSLD